jgi:hypothetical protein
VATGHPVLNVNIACSGAEALDRVQQSALQMLRSRRGVGACHAGLMRSERMRLKRCRIMQRPESISHLAFNDCLICVGGCVSG